MPITKVKAPDGSIIKVNHPEGASQEEIIAFAQQQFQAPPNVGVGGLTQEEIRSRRLAGVPLDEEEAAIMQRELLKETQDPLKALAANYSATILKAIEQTRATFGDEAAAQRAKEIEDNLNRLRDLVPGSVFGETLAIGSTIPAAGGATGLLAGRLGGGLVSKLASGALVGAGEGQAFRDTSEDALTAAAKGAAFGAGGEALGAAAKKGIEAFARRGMKQADEALGGVRLDEPFIEETVEAGQEAVESAKKFDIDLFPGQVLKGQKAAEQVFVTKSSSAAAKAAKSLQQQNQQVYDATQRILNDLAPGSTLGDFAKKARSVSQLAIEQAKEARKAATSPLYNDVFERAKGLEVDLSPIKSEINQIVKDLPQVTDLGPALKRVLGGLTKKNGQLLSDPKAIHEARSRLGSFLYSKAGRDLAPDAAGAIKDYRTKLLGILEDSVPGYREATSEYHRLTAPITDLEDGIIGSIAQLDDVNLKTVANKLLEPSNIIPSEVKKVKQIFESVPGGKEAWRAVVKGEMQRRVGSVNFDPENILDENLPNKLATAIFGGQKAETLYRAVDPATEANLRLFRKVLRSAGDARNIGSTTVEKTGLKKTLTAKAISGIKKVTAPFSSLDQWATSISDDRAIAALADKIFDPVVQDHLTAMRKALKAKNRIPTKQIEQLNRYLGVTGAATSSTGE